MSHPEQTRVAVIYYSATGGVHALAEAVAQGAEKEGAEVRLLHVAESVPDAIVASNDQWSAHRRAVQEAGVPTPGLDDLEWADAVVFGSPSRFGLPAAQLKAFLDSTGPLWGQGKLADKVYSSFTSSGTAHGGQESTILAINNAVYHFGGIIVPTGYTDPIIFSSTGNPYGSSFTSNNGATPATDAELEAARFQGSRVARVASDLKAGRLAA